jgi:glycosyltransferase involved in cell wall biosynthesis
VLAQTVQTFEIVVVDDGSTDGGGELVRAFRDSRIRLIRQQNAGVSSARNRGIQAATGDYVAFLDADDVWRPGFLETVEGLATRHPEAGLYATAYRLCREDVCLRPAFEHCPNHPAGGLIEDYFRAAMRTQPVWTSATMVPKAVFGELGGFPTDVTFGEDLCMWTRIALRYPVAWSPVEGAWYDLGADNRICTTDIVLRDTPVAREFEEMLRSGRITMPPDSTLNEYLVCLRLPIALRLHLAGQTMAALRLLRKTKGTVRFRRRRRETYMALMVPPVLLPHLLRARLALLSNEPAFDHVEPIAGAGTPSEASG